MEVNGYKQQLLELEARISSHLRRDLASGREQLVDTAADAGDASVADESESEDFTEAELNTTTLQQVQAALRRIENGTFGQCLVDGGPIELKRLDAIPWAPLSTAPNTSPLTGEWPWQCDDLRYTFRNVHRSTLVRVATREPLAGEQTTKEELRTRNASWPEAADSFASHRAMRRKLRVAAVGESSRIAPPPRVVKSLRGPSIIAIRGSRLARSRPIAARSAGVAKRSALRATTRTAQWKATAAKPRRLST
jgi:DnaK suppressor protein